MASLWNPASDPSGPVLTPFSDLGADSLRRALDAAAIVAVTDTKGVIVDCNRKFVDVSGYSRAELIGATHRLVNSGHHDRAFFVNLYRTIGAGRIWRGTLCNRRKDGSLYWVDTTIVPSLGGDGRPVAYIAIRFEVTDHIRALQALEQARETAERATRVRDRFLANMSHEVRTPLNGILGLASALIRSPLNDADHEKVELVLSSGQSLRRILDDVLDLSKIQAGEMQLIEQVYAPARELADAAELMRGMAENKGLTLNVSVDDRLPGHLFGDPVRVRQIVSNLVSNAVKFTATGRVAVSLAARGRAGRRRLRVCVSDTGRGFTRTVGDRLFGSFVQLEGDHTREFGGTGLGLSISRELATMMGGELTVRSSPGRGSVFMLNLPLVEASSSVDVEKAAPGARTDIGGMKVLLVEDNVVNRKVVAALLEPFDVEIDEAENGEDGLARWRVGRYDMVLMDMQMPVMDGLEAIRHIRAEEAGRGGRRGPIAMLTANASETHRDEALKAGADIVIAKPFTGESLLSALARLE